MSKQRIAKIVKYDAAHEIGLIRTEDDNYWVVEGPITSEGPFRWIRESASFSGAAVQYDATLRAARL